MLLIPDTPRKVQYICKFIFFIIYSNDINIFLKFILFGDLFRNLSANMMMTMNCFCGMVNRRKAFSLISSRDHCQRSSPSRTSDTPKAEFEPVQNLSLGWSSKWSCAVVITTTSRCHAISQNYNLQISWNSLKLGLLDKHGYWYVFPILKTLHGNQTFGYSVGTPWS